VKLKGDTVQVPGNLVFATGSAILTPTPENEEILNQLKAYLLATPKITLLRVEGHTDNVGDTAKNMKLSGDRALVIKKWLVSQGIADSRLVAVGFGDGKPVADNSSDAGRAQNRRTQFKVAAINGKPYLGRPATAGGTEFK
jgi:OOP family OmpA-OmpF porin